MLATDWSQKGMGAVLSQIDEEGKEHPLSCVPEVANLLRKITEVVKENASRVVQATQNFREYLFGTPFTFYTDHEPLKWLMQTNNTTRKLARWSLLLQEYDMKVVHKRGVLNTNANSPIRYPNQAPANGPPLPNWNKGD